MIVTAAIEYKSIAHERAMVPESVRMVRCLEAMISTSDLSSVILEPANAPDAIVLQLPSRNTLCSR